MSVPGPHPSSSSGGMRVKQHDQLTQDALEEHTLRYPANASRTVERYLLQQKGIRYPLVKVAAPDAPSQLDSSFESTAASPRTATALTLHADPKRFESERAKSREVKHGSIVEPDKKRKTVVGAMKPRATPTSSGATTNNANTPVVAALVAEPSKPMLKTKPLAAIHEIAEVVVPTKSPPLKARAGVNAGGGGATKPASSSRNGAGKPQENKKPEEDKPEVRKKRPRVLGEEDDMDTAEEDAVLARLDARREKRRAKAVIVKDKTVSAAKIGANAGKRLKASISTKRKSRGKADDGSEAEESSEEEQAPRKKKTRASGANAAAGRLLRLEKPDGITQQRLTLPTGKPLPKLGLFGGGAASKKIKLGKPVSDLVFSEMEFLNRPRRVSPPASVFKDVGPSKRRSTRSAKKDPVDSDSDNQKRRRSPSRRHKKASDAESSSSLSDIESESSLPSLPKPKTKAKRAAIDAPSKRAQHHAAKQSSKRSAPSPSPSEHSAHSLMARERARTKLKESKAPTEGEGTEPEDGHATEVARSVVLDTSKHFPARQPVVAQRAAAAPKRSIFAMTHAAASSAPPARTTADLVQDLEDLMDLCDTPAVDRHEATASFWLDLGDGKQEHQDGQVNDDGDGELSYVDEHEHQMEEAALEPQPQQPVFEDDVFEDDVFEDDLDINAADALRTCSPAAYHPTAEYGRQRLSHDHIPAHARTMDDMEELFTPAQSEGQHELGGMSTEGPFATAAPLKWQDASFDSAEFSVHHFQQQRQPEAGYVHYDLDEGEALHGHGGWPSREEYVTSEVSANDTALEQQAALKLKEKEEMKALWYRAGL